ncbi:hypothetical protein [Hyunsoonleella jejuensis]|uniref:hypothetical protein n=1 Tax=Hyunsoonleella jejuensis TaxID=419940 RepID=UPI001C42E721|nr:hypothetical protein [Hyunsoonleella jejuensis]
MQFIVWGFIVFPKDFCFRLWWLLFVTLQRKQTFNEKSDPCEAFIATSKITVIL